MRRSERAERGGQLGGGVGVGELPPTVPRLRMCTWPTWCTARGNTDHAPAASGRPPAALARQRADEQVVAVGAEMGQLG